MRAGVRWIFIIHRYAGIILSLLMLMWCLSGIVMMYVPYPSLGEAERAAGLKKLDWHNCCDVPAAAQFRQFSIVMLHDRLVLRDATDTFDLKTARRVDRILPDDARAAAAVFARGNSLAGEVSRVRRIQNDQWTVAGEFRRDRPLYLLELNDPADTHLYVSGTTGTVVQSVNRLQRIWNYLGAVPHWLYFTELRAQPQAWAQVVIWTSLAGSLLVLAGLYVGIRQWLRARHAHRWSPYRGFMWWHHIPGLVFGIFLLSWVFSGLLSMNPWGLLEGDGARAQSRALMGPTTSKEQLTTALRNISRTPSDADFVSLTSTPLAGRLYLMAAKSDGTRQRLDTAGTPAPLTSADLAFISRTIHSAGAWSLLNQGDDYYFNRPGEQAQSAVWRSIASNGDRYYVDPVSGKLLARLDSGARGYRWWFQGLHRLDFTATIRTRPLWDIVMLVLLAGASGIAATGTWLAVLYLLRAGKPRKPGLRSRHSSRTGFQK